MRPLLSAFLAVASFSMASVVYGQSEPVSPSPTAASSVPQSESTAWSDSNFYAELPLGYAFRNWGNVFDLNQVAVTKKNGGVTYGLDMGYVISNRLSAELGWTHLPKARFSTDDGSGRITSNIYHIGARLAMPLRPMLSAFVLLALGYSNHEISHSGLTFLGGSSHTRYWGSYLSIGLRYTINEHFYVTTQYTYAPGLQTPAPYTDRFATPNLSMLRLSVGYALPF